MPKKKVSPHLRKLVADRALGCSEYCMSQEQYSTHGFSIDHINPGGSSDPDNLALACQGCNNFKFTKKQSIDPDTGATATIFNPRTDEWKSHFRWNENYTLIVGITPTGRSTVNALQLNRDFLQNQRALYRAAGIHPPAHSVA